MDTTMTIQEIESGRPSVSALQAVQFCLDMLYQDKEHQFCDSVVTGLSYELLVGAFLAARDSIQREIKLDEQYDDWEIAPCGCQFHACEKHGDAIWGIVTGELP